MNSLDSISKKKIQEIKQLQPKPIKKRFCGWIFGVIFLLVFAANLFYGYYLLIQPETINNPLTFEIKSGETVDQISQNLKKAGIIHSTLLFKLYLVMKNKASTIQSGVFVFSGMVNIPQVVNLITSAENTKNQVTIYEGMRIEEIALYLESQGYVKSADFISEAKKIEKYQAKYSFLKGLSKKDTLEGFLFPDTYKIKTEASASEIIDKMLENFNNKVYQVVQPDLNQKNMNLKDVVILASIIEREVKNPQERAVVAGIYYNRLKLKMKLEADPTVQYAKDTESPPLSFKDFWQKISVKDYRAVISPYNTYLNTGLPPTPICNPGLISIKAALNPTTTDYLYFFTTDGQVYYSKTAAEHEQKKAEYLK